MFGPDLRHRVCSSILLSRHIGASGDLSQWFAEAGLYASMGTLTPGGLGEGRCSVFHREPSAGAVSCALLTARGGRGHGPSSETPGGAPHPNPQMPDTRQTSPPASPPSGSRD